MTLLEIKLGDIKVSPRLRQIDQDKVDNLVESIRLVGLLHPIVVDTDNNLLAGNHRLEAHRILGRDTIECKVVNFSELENELVQIDENLINNDLSMIEKSEHIILRESILDDLGIRATQGENQHGSVKSYTTSKLASELEISKRKYQWIKQISKINHTAREILKYTDISNNLDALLQIERLRDDELQIEVATRIERGHSTHSGNIRRLIKDVQNEIKRDSILEQLGNYKNSSHKKLQLYQGDFREVSLELDDNSIDMIFTDPPYITDDSLELYEGLSELGNRVLKDGGSCLCYVTQAMLHKVLNVMSSNLDYYWIISIKHGGNNGRHGRGVFVEWKPMLWFVKGKRKRSDFVADFVFSEDSGKTFHDWEQSIKEADYYISHLTNIGDTILDPMMGSGTTGVSALGLNRDFIGIEKEKRTFDIAQARISETVIQ